ncbi:MAG: hypothetical protein O6947_04865 [Acidobacteria bacterium]|nr:hypothetical protein [Acidobacteriota bacterium]
MAMPEGLNAGGIFFLVTAWSVITGLVVFCFWKILKSPSGGKD